MVHLMVAGGSRPVANARANRDPFRELERVALRRSWWASGSFFALVAAPVVVLTVLEPPAVDQLPYFGLNIGIFFAFPVAYLLALRWGIRRTIRRLMPLRPFVREAGAPVFGPVLELEGALILSMTGGAAMFTRFYGPGGEALQVGPPRAAEWMRWSRLRRVAFIRSARSARPEASELRALNALLGASFSGATVSIPRGSVRSPAAPNLVVTFSCYRMFSAVNVDRIVSNLSRIDRFLGTLQDSYRGHAASP